MEHPCQATVFLDVSHSPITLIFYFCILWLTHAHTDSLRTPWIPAQAEITLLHPLFHQAPRLGQDTPYHPTAMAALWSFLSPVPQARPRLKSQPNFSDASCIAHLPAQLCCWQTSHTNGRQWSDHKLQQAPWPPRHCHTGRGRVGSPCPEDAIATPHLRTFTHAGVGRDAKTPWRHVPLLKRVP